MKHHYKQVNRLGHNMLLLTCVISLGIDEEPRTLLSLVCAWRCCRSRLNRVTGAVPDTVDVVPTDVSSNY